MPAQRKKMITLYRTVRDEHGEKWDRIVLDKPSQTFSIASEKEKFDYYIKRQLILGATYLPGSDLINKNESSFGYFLKRYRRFYDRYLSPKVQIDSILSSEIKKQYDEGKGNEFKTGKFYSVASSSRFAVSNFSERSVNGIIELIKKIEINGLIEDVKVSLERGLYIDGMPNNNFVPQMDVVIETNSSDIYFIEVKCHEIFDTSEHKKIKLKTKYLEATMFNRLPLEFQKISKIVVDKNGITEKYISINGNYLEAVDFNCNISTTHFDFKQFICHVMGVLSYKIKNPNTKLHLFYLFYKNDEYLKNGNYTIYQELEKEMLEIFKVFSSSFPEIEFGYLYNNQFDTLKSLKKEVT